MKFLSFLKKFDSSRRKQRYKAQTEAFAQACKALTADDIAIDCGANVGLYTVMMAESGAQVYAFEPNPIAFEALSQNTARFSNVRLFNAAASTQAGTIKLYMHKKAQQDPLLYSVSSSVIATKSNIDSASYQDVESVILADFIESLDGPVKLLKMDVEGAEIDLLNQILDRNLQSKIKQGFVEVHDRRVPSLKEPTKVLRERLNKENASHITLDWR